MYSTVKDLTAEIESRIDISNVVDYLGFKKGSGDSSFYCGIHNENNPSFIAKKGRQTWKCLSKCGTGNLYQLVEKVKGGNYIQAVKELAGLAGISESEINLGDELTKLTDSLKPLQLDHLEYLLNKRGITELTAKAFNLQSSGEYIVFPQILSDSLVGYKFLSIIDKTKKFFKGINTQSKLYPDNNFDDTEIVIFTAGEWDCLYLSQELEKYKSQGLLEAPIKVVSNSTGEGSYPLNLVQNLTRYNEKITAFKIFYDNDQAGKTGALKLANALHTLGKRIDIFTFHENAKKGYDVSDFFKEGFTVDDLFSLPREKFNPDMNKRSEGTQYDTERDIINFLIINNEFIPDGMELVQATDIKDYRFSMLFSNIKFLYEKYKYCDFDLLKKKTRDISVKESIDEIIGASALGSFEEFKELVEILRENTTVRNLQKFASVVSAISAQKLSRKEMISEVGKNYEKLIIESTLDEKGKTLDLILQDYLNSLNDNEETRFIPSPFDELNEHLGGGLRVKKLSILGALPSLGKTSICIQWADFAVQNNISTGYYALETDNEELSEMVLSRRSGLEKYYYSKKSFPESISPTEIITKQMKENDKNFHFIEAYGMTAREVINDIRVKVRKYGLKFVVIDLLQAFKTEKGYASRSEFMADLSIDLVNLPKEENIALLCLSHLKAPEGNLLKPKPPQIYDLAQTSELGRRGYTVLMLDSKDKLTTDVDLIIRKSRNGSADLVVPLFFHRHVANFVGNTTGKKFDE